MLERVKVDTTTHSYSVTIGAGALNLLCPLVGELERLPTGIVLVVDVAVDAFADTVSDHLNEGFSQIPQLRLDISGGEQSKTLAQLGLLVDDCLAADPVPDRGALVVAVGGGTVGDLAGFFASTYMRGLPIIQVPTTTLAIVDASVGGKTAVNRADTKNVIGSFHQPQGVIADLDALMTLPDREYREGLAEAIKIAAVRDASFFAQIEADVAALKERDRSALLGLCKRAVELKADVVWQDEREAGLRACLNFGHTIGHAIEGLSPEREVLHGEAVGIGMVCAMRIAKVRGLTSDADTERLVGLLAELELPLRVPDSLTSEQLLREISRDKKRNAAGLRWVLPKGIGDFEFWDDPEPAATLDIALAS